MIFRAPLFTRIVSWSVHRCSGFLLTIMIVCLLTKSTFSNESLRWKFSIATIPILHQNLDKCCPLILIESCYKWSAFTFLKEKWFHIIHPSFLFARPSLRYNQCCFHFNQLSFIVLSMGLTNLHFIRTIVRNCQLNSFI